MALLRAGAAVYAADKRFLNISPCLSVLDVCLRRLSLYPASCDHRRLTRPPGLWCALRIACDTHHRGVPETAIVSAFHNWSVCSRAAARSHLACRLACLVAVNAPERSAEPWRTARQIQARCSHYAHKRRSCAIL